MLVSLDSGIVLESPDTAFIRPERTVCITGHREKSIVPFLDDPEYIHLTRSAVRLMLYRYIDMALEKGYTDFFSGLADGTDLWAAEYILIKKHKDPNIRLIGAMPFLKHSRFFSNESRSRLCDVEKGADCLILINSDPNIVYGKTSGLGKSPDLYKDRNYFMVDNSAAVLAFFDERNPRSGTGQTVGYALRKGRNVRSFGLSDVYDVMNRARLDWKAISTLIRETENVF
ncbi:MAG: DUF1273 family protein [Ruminococcus sp.]|nr:DUF1273 family protein [Ruminococcus sp.]